MQVDCVLKPRYKKVYGKRSWVVSGLPGAKVCRGTELSSDQSQMYNIATIGLPITLPVDLNR